MIVKPMDVLTNYEVRKSKKQKTAFITAVTAYAASQRYSIKLEKGSLGCRNIVIGDPEKADYLITAHYDTCAWLPFPNLLTPFSIPLFMLNQLFMTVMLMFVAFLPAILVYSFAPDASWSKPVALLGYFAVLFLILAGPANRHTANDNTSGVATLLSIMDSLPENQRHKVCFVLFDLEESGLLGSASYRKAHKAATNRQIVLNMDCVGDGDELVLIPNKKLRKQEPAMAKLRKLSGSWGRKSLTIHEKGVAIYPSDQANFPNGVAVAAFRRSNYPGLPGTAPRFSPPYTPASCFRQYAA